jgi:hypothetical protein
MAPVEKVERGKQKETETCEFKFFWLAYDVTLDGSHPMSSKSVTKIFVFFLKFFPVIFSFAKSKSK